MDDGADVTDRQRELAALIRRTVEESEPAPYGPQFEALHALIAEQLAIWLDPTGSGTPDPDKLDSIAEMIAWEIEAVFPVGPQRTPVEAMKVLRERRAAQLEARESDRDD